MVTHSRNAHCLVAKTVIARHSITNAGRWWTHRIRERERRLEGHPKADNDATEMERALIKEEDELRAVISSKEPVIFCSGSGV